MVVIFGPLPAKKIVLAQRFHLEILEGSLGRLFWYSISIWSANMRSPVPLGPENGPIIMDGTFSLVRVKVGTGFLSRSTNGNGKTNFKEFQLHYIGYLQD